MRKNWKSILIILLVLFSLGKCTQSCNRSLKIDELESTVAEKDSMINSMSRQIELLQIDTTNYRGRLHMYEGFTEAMTINIEKQNNISEKNARLQAEQNAKISKLERQLEKQENVK